MDEFLHKATERYAHTTLDWLDCYAKIHNVKQGELVELFIDTLRALEQYRSQEG